MPTIDLYIKPWCPYCARVKALLNQKNLEYNEIDISTDGARENEMRVRSGRRTVPQVFINDHHVGGSDDLIAAEATGLIDKHIADESHHTV